MRTPPASAGVTLTIIGESSASPCRIHCANAATALKPVHAAKYPSTNIPVGTNGRSCSWRFRLTVANARIIGAAEGSIIAAIISVHIANRAIKVAADHPFASGPDIVVPAHEQTPLVYIPPALAAMLN